MTTAEELAQAEHARRSMGGGPMATRVGPMGEPAKTDPMDEDALGYKPDQPRRGDLPAAVPMENDSTLDVDALSLSIHEVTRKSITFRPEAAIGTSGLGASRVYDQAGIVVDSIQEGTASEFYARRKKVHGAGFALLWVKPTTKTVGKMRVKSWEPMYPAAASLVESVRLAVAAKAEKESDPS